MFQTKACASLASVPPSMAVAFLPASKKTAVGILQCKKKVVRYYKGKENEATFNFITVTDLVYGRVSAGQCPQYFTPKALVQ